MFVGQDFVLKHIRTKHGEKVEEFKSQVLAVFLCYIVLPIYTAYRCAHQ